MQHIKIGFAITAIAVLVACGGGGGGEAGGSDATQPTKATGTVMDGYLAKAFVFLDANENGIYNLGEPNTFTDEKGSFDLTLEKSQINKHPIIAVAIPGTTIDMDNPNSAITQQYSLTAPIEKASIISPITTLIASKVSSGLSLQNAENSVKSELGIGDLDLYKDYVSEKKYNANYQQLHNIAAATTEILKSIEVTDATSKSLTEKLNAVNKNFSTDDFRNQLSSIKQAKSTNEAAQIGAEKTLSAIAIAYKTIVNSMISTISAAMLVM